MSPAESEHTISAQSVPFLEHKTLLIICQSAGGLRNCSTFLKDQEKPETLIYAIEHLMLLITMNDFLNAVLFHMQAETRPSPNAVSTKKGQCMTISGHT